MKDEGSRVKLDIQFKIQNFKSFLIVGGILIALLALFLIGKFIVANLPTSPAPNMIVTSRVTVTFTAVPPTQTLIITPPPNSALAVHKFRRKTAW